MASIIRRFLFVEAAAFTIAALIHGGLLVGGYAHREARIAEGVIALVLWAGLAVAWIRPAAARGAGLAAQGFALLLTLVGITTMVIGVGPRTVADVVYHIAIVIVLAWGLLITLRSPAVDQSSAAPGAGNRVRASE